MSRTAALALALAAAPRLCLAHAEHYGQSSHLTVRPEGVEVELELSPGAQVAAAFLHGADADGDRVISEVERRDFGARVARDLSLTVDDRPAPLRVEHVFVPDVATIETGEGMAVVRAVAPVRLARGAHRLCFTNGHAPLPSAWSVNVFSGSSAVALAAPTRSEEGRALCAAFVLTGAPPVPAPPTAPAPMHGRAAFGLALVGLAAGLGAVAWRARR